MLPKAQGKKVWEVKNLHRVACASEDVQQRNQGRTEKGLGWHSPWLRQGQRWGLFRASTIIVN